MKTLDTIAGHTYVVSSPNGGTVTSADGIVKETVEAGKQKVVFGTGAPLQLDDDAGKIMATFKLAPVKLRLLGLLGGGSSTGGGSVLPAGYLASEFLESNGLQYIETSFHVGGASSVRCVYCYTENKNNTFPFGAADGYPVDMFRLARDIDHWAIQYSKSTKHVSGEFDIKTDFRLKAGETTLNGTPIEVNYVDFETESPLFIFASSQNGVLYSKNNIMPGRIYLLEIDETNVLVPAVDNNGVPCMCDKVTKQPFYNSGTGSFVVGFTLAQALKLSKLPATGGSLTISLPTGYESDAGVANALETARGNGWTITVQTYTPEAEASSAATFGMRRIWVRRTADDNGMYVDTDGKRWTVDWCVAMYAPDGSEPDAHGYELFRSQEAAVAYWELQPWVDPEAENLLLNQGE